MVSGVEGLITDKETRNKIAENAYNFCKKKCVTLYTGFQLAKFIKSMMTPNIVFVLPALNISGGIMVALEHCKMLKKKTGMTLQLSMMTLTAQNGVNSEGLNFRSFLAERI